MYRKKVVGIVFNDNGEYLVDQLVNYNKNEWNFPGGGIEKGETEDSALLRELKEELGTDKFDIIRKGKNLNTYNWPIRLIFKRCIQNKGFWIGQSARYFLVRFIGHKDDIKPNSKELKKIKWIKRQEFKKYLVFANQLKVIENELKQIE